jgi:hypothetical protein
MVFPNISKIFSDASDWVSKTIESGTVAFKAVVGTPEEANEALKAVADDSKRRELILGRSSTLGEAIDDYTATRKVQFEFKIFKEILGPGFLKFEKELQTKIALGKSENQATAALEDGANMCINPEAPVCTPDTIDLTCH